MFRLVFVGRAVDRLVAIANYGTSSASSGGLSHIALSEGCEADRGKGGGCGCQGRQWGDCQVGGRELWGVLERRQVVHPGREVEDLAEKPGDDEASKGHPCGADGPGYEPEQRGGEPDEQPQCRRVDDRGGDQAGYLAHVGADDPVHESDTQPSSGEHGRTAGQRDSEVAGGPVAAGDGGG